LGDWVEFDKRAAYHLQINGMRVQSGSLVEMSWSAEELISKLADWAPIGKGDVLFTGTPSGVGPLNAGDEVTASLYVDSELVSKHSATCL
jgi:fumarylpyruvate hydrolase